MVARKHTKSDQSQTELLNFSDYTKTICNSLFKKTGVIHFSYVEVDRKGNYFWLDSSSDYLEKCLDSQLVNEAPINIIKTYPKPGLYLIDVYAEEYKRYSQSVFSMLHHFDYGHSFRIMEISPAKPQMIKLYCFEAPLNRDDMNHFYINNLNLFNQFSAHFNQKLSLIRTLLNPLAIPDYKDFISQVHGTPPSSFCEYSKPTTLPFLTKREKELLQWHLKGKTSQEIAEILMVSRRTIERHFENLREKFHCSSKNQIAVKLLQDKHSYPELIYP